MKYFKIGGELILDIIDINSEGQGVGKYEGFTLFTNGGTLGDKVKAKVIEIKKNFGIADTLEILEKSPYRVKSECQYFPQCDGCQLHNLNYEKQLELKRDMVKNNLNRIGKISDVLVKDTIGMDYAYRYRNKGEFKVGKDYNIGYFKRGTHDLIPIDECIIQDKIADEINALVKEYMKEYGIEGYDNRTKKGIIKNLIIRTTKDNKAMVVIVTKGEKLPHKEGLIDILTDEDRLKSATVVSIYQNIKEKDTSVVLGHKDIKLYGEDRIVDYIGEYKFLISPKSFFQVNHIQTEILYDKVVEYLDLKGHETVIDLYCGIGTIALYISKYANKVYGVEVVRDAIEDANNNLKLNHVDNVEFIRGKSEDILPKVNKKGIKIDALVVDPPRKGLNKSLIDSIVKANPQKIVYVSCNPSTLARDLGYLMEKGYEIEEVQPVDMFPMSMHVESIIMMTYCGSEEK